MIVFAIAMADLAQPLTTQRSAIARFAEAYPLTLFFLLAYAWSWTGWLLMSRIVPEGSISPGYEMFLEGLFAVTAFGPTVAALVTSWLAYRSLRICRLWTGWRSLIQGLGFGLSAFIVATLIAPNYAILKAPISAWQWPALLHWSTYGINFSFFFGGPVNEEPGWRGFALPRLQDRFGAVGATLILAPLWAGWHTPLFWMEGWTSATPWEFVLILVGISFLFTAAANFSKFSVIVAMALHAFFNTSSRLGNALSVNLPRRPHEMIIYTFAVLVCGAAIGIAALGLTGKLKRETEAILEPRSGERLQPTA